jgi:hypothetical protein
MARSHIPKGANPITPQRASLQQFDEPPQDNSYMMSSITAKSHDIGRVAANDVMFGTGRGPIHRQARPDPKPQPAKPQPAKKGKKTHMLPYPSDYRDLSKCVRG